MVKGCEELGLFVWIGGQLYFLENVFFVLVVLFIIVVIVFFIEFVSNIVIIIIFLLVLVELVICLRVYFLYLMILGIVGCFFVFMFLVLMFFNFIVFVFGYLLVKDMVWIGFLMNLMGVLLFSLVMNIWVQIIFQLGIFLDWVDMYLVNVIVLLFIVVNDIFWIF